MCVARDRVHQVAYLRNSVAHPKPQPTLAEMVAGTMAILEVLRDHGQLQAVQEIEAMLQELQEASWLQSGAFCRPSIIALPAALKQSAQQKYFVSASS